VASTLAGKLNKSLSRLGRGFKEIWECIKEKTEEMTNMNLNQNNPLTVFRCGDVSRG